MSHKCFVCEQLLVCNNHKVTNITTINYYYNIHNYKQINRDFCIHNFNYYEWCKPCCSGRNGICTSNCDYYNVLKDNYNLTYNNNFTLFIIQPEIYVNNTTLINTICAQNKYTIQNTYEMF
jgi:hypothetical protein